MNGGQIRVPQFIIGENHYMGGLGPAISTAAIVYFSYRKYTKTVYHLTSKSGQLATSMLEQRTKTVVSTDQVGCSYFFKIVGVVVATVS